MEDYIYGTAYFATVWIGRHVRHEVLAEHLARLGKRLGEVPQFAAYAIADGLKRAFTRFGKWVRTAEEAAMAESGPATGPLLPGFADILDLDDGSPLLEGICGNPLPETRLSLCFQGCGALPCSKNG